MVYRHKFRLRLEDVGADGMVTNRAILAMLEDVAGLHSDTVGFGLMDISENGVAWVLLNWRVQILKRPMYKDCVECHTWSRGTEKICALRDFDLYSDSGELLVIGASRWLMIDLDRRRPVRLNQEVLEKYEPEPDYKVFAENIKDLVPAEDSEYSEEYKVLRRDMDINGHVHNLSYLDAAYEVIPLDIYRNRVFNQVQITYKKEILEGDKVIMSYKKLQNNICQVKFESAGHINAIVELS